MQAAAQLIDQLITQLQSAPIGRPSATTVIEPSTVTNAPRWSTNPLCDGGDDLDEDEAYFLGDDDEDEETDYDDDDEDDNYEFDDDDDDDFDDDVNLDEEDF